MEKNDYESDLIQQLIQQIRLLNEKINETQPRKWLNRAEAAKHAGLDIQTIDQLRNTDKLRFHPVGRRILIDVEELNRTIKEHTPEWNI